MPRKREFMKITDISEASKSKLKIFIDGEFSFVLYKGELRSLKLKVGDELDEAVYKEITNAILPRRCKLRAMHLLEKKPYTEAEIRRKLRDNMYPEDIISSTVDYLKGFNYINDHDYACQYIQTYADSKSLKLMSSNLIQKGISKKDLDSAIEQVRELGDMPNEREQIAEALRKKGYDKESADDKTRAKIARYLYGKGFSSELIMDMI